MVGVGVFNFQGLCDSFLTVHMHDTGFFKPTGFVRPTGFVSLC